MRSLCAFVITCLFAASTYANAVIQLNGKLRGFDEKTIFVESSAFIYQVKRAALSATQQTYVKSLHSGAPVSLSLDTTAIASVTDLKKPKK